MGRLSCFRNSRTVSLILLCGTLSSCASMSNRSKTILTMSAAGLAGCVIGAAGAPVGENALAHGALWGGAAATVAGVAGLFFFDEQKRSDELERQNNVMRKELDAFRDEIQGASGSHDPKLLYETTAPFGKEIPTEYQGLVRPGHWSVYRLNQWVQQGEGTMIHQDRLVKLVPPQLTPAISAGAAEGVVPSAKGSEITGPTADSKQK